MDDVCVSSEPDRTEASLWIGGPLPQGQDAIGKQRRPQPGGLTLLRLCGEVTHLSQFRNKDPELGTHRWANPVCGPQTVVGKQSCSRGSSINMVVALILHWHPRFLKSIPNELALEFVANHTVCLRTCVHRTLGSTEAVLVVIGWIRFQSGPRVSLAACVQLHGLPATKRQPAVSTQLETRHTLLEVGIHASDRRDFVSDHHPRQGTTIVF